jgi:hypothetical protein
MDQPRHCRKCYYILDGLPEPTCPECGTTFDPNDPATYLTKPMFVRWKFWLPGFLLAFGVGLALYLILVAAAGWGFATTLVVPFSVGAILGYSCRAKKSLMVLLVLLLIIPLVFTLISFSIVGIFCGLVLGGIALGPAIIGLIMGVALRAKLKKSKFSQRSYLPILFFVLLPLVWGAIEGQKHRDYALETVTTSEIFNAPPGTAYRTVVFYEEVKLARPWLLRLGLPRPLYARGASAKPGDIKVCFYSKGQLAKRIVTAEPGKLLAFEVVRQWNIEDHDVRLTTGSFNFDDLGDGRTRVTLATEYKPFLGPRFIWRPFERWAVHTLHGQVLAGMKEQLQ